MAENLNFKSLTDDRYSVGGLCYPNDLLSGGVGENTYGNNCIVFHINVHEASKFLKEDKTDIIAEYAPDNTQSGRIVNNGETAETAVGAVAIGSLVTLVTTQNVRTATIGGVLGATGVAALNIGVNGEKGFTFNRSLKRLKSTIVLHAPNQYMSRYGTQWGEENTDIYQQAHKLPESLMKGVMEAVKAGSVASIVENQPQYASSVAALALKLLPGKEALSAITGKATNPKKEQIFGGVDFRTFNFEYQFFPRSLSEYNNIKDIIKLFKMHMHPEYFDNDNFLFIYPSEFDIEHLNNGKTNEHLPKHESCVLTEMNVNYSPNAQFTSFHGGIPTQINVTMTFRELSILTKQRIDQGY